MNKRQLQYQHTLEAIRGAVDALVGELGFEHMRIKDITAHAGISEGAFYHYFSSKNDLLFDRYHRANQQSLARYEEDLRHMHEIDALKEIIYSGNAGLKSRVMDVLIPYQKAALDDYVKWAEKEADSTVAIYQRVIERGLMKGNIRPVYTARQMLDFLRMYVEGKTILYCRSRGDFLGEGFSDEVLIDWLESLRG